MRFWLKRRILALYGSQTIFARACGRNDYWISRIITGRQDPTEEEKKLICEKLAAEGNQDFLFNKCGSAK